MTKRDRLFLGAVAAGVVALTLIIAALMWVIPTYRVWQREMSGQAELRQAEWNRQIAVREAMAALESAKHLADAEIERARGVAEANRIIADGLGGADGYLHYLWVQTLSATGNQIIYVPTESQLPLLEAGRVRQ